MSLDDVTVYDDGSIVERPVFGTAIEPVDRRPSVVTGFMLMSPIGHQGEALILRLEVSDGPPVDYGLTPAAVQALARELDDAAKKVL